MHPALRIITLPLFTVVGLIMLLLSIPLIMLAILVLMGGSEDYADWILDRTPINFWYGLMEEIR